MKLLCRFGVFVMVCGGLVGGGRAGTETEAAIAAVLAANQARNEALVARDLARLDRLLAPDFNYTHSTNFQETKSSHLDAFEQGLRYTKYETSALRAKVLTPDVITLNGIFDQTKCKAGDMKSGRYLFLAVWRKTGGIWQLTTFQSALPPLAN